MVTLDKRIFFILCRYYVSCTTAYVPMNAFHISAMLDISVYKVRYELTKLKNQGLVKSVREYLRNMWGEPVGLTSGWRLTEKAKLTGIYQLAVKLHEKELKKLNGNNEIQN